MKKESIGQCWPIHLEIRYLIHTITCYRLVVLSWRYSADHTDSLRYEKKSTISETQWCICIEGLHARPGNQLLLLEKRQGSLRCTVENILIPKENYINVTLRARKESTPGTPYHKKSRVVPMLSVTQTLKKIWDVITGLNLNIYSSYRLTDECPPPNTVPLFVRIHQSFGVSTSVQPQLLHYTHTHTHTHTTVHMFSVTKSCNKYRKMYIKHISLQFPNPLNKHLGPIAKVQKSALKAVPGVSNKADLLVNS